MSIEERLDRIASTSHVVRMDDKSIYEVNGIIKLADDVIFVECGDDLWFQDLDVFTLEEAHNAEVKIAEAFK